MGRECSARRPAQIATLAALAVAAFVTNVSAAEARPHGRHGGSCGGDKGMLEKLERDVAGLGLAQKELDAVYQVIDQARKERRPLDAELRTAHERMRELLEQDQPDADAVAAQADAIGALATQVRKIDLRAAVQVRAMLTPEQRKQLGEMRERFARRGARGPEL